MPSSLLSRRRQRYVELHEESESVVAELRVMPTISLSWSSSSNSGSNSSGQASVKSEPQTNTEETRDEQANVSRAKKIKSTLLWKRLRATLTLKRRKQTDTDDSSNRIGIAASPRQYLVGSTKEEKHKKSRSYLKRRLKLLTICEHEEYDDSGLYEC
jgi:hypothetical protein